MPLNEVTISGSGLVLDEFAISGLGWHWMKLQFPDRDGIE